MILGGTGKVRKKGKRPPDDLRSEGLCPECGLHVRGTQKRPSWVNNEGTFHMDCLSKREKIRKKQQQNEQK